MIPVLSPILSIIYDSDAFKDENIEKLLNSEKIPLRKEGLFPRTVDLSVYEELLDWIPVNDEKLPILDSLTRGDMKKKEKLKNIVGSFPKKIIPIENLEELKKTLSSEEWTSEKFIGLGVFLVGALRMIDLGILVQLGTVLNKSYLAQVVIELAKIFALRASKE